MSHARAPHHIHCLLSKVCIVLRALGFSPACIRSFLLVFLLQSKVMEVLLTGNYFNYKLAIIMFVFSLETRQQLVQMLPAQKLVDSVNIFNIFGTECRRKECRQFKVNC